MLQVEKWKSEKVILVWTNERSLVKSGKQAILLSKLEQKRLAAASHICLTLNLLRI